MDGRADRLEITEVHARPEGDTFSPPFDPADWEEVARVRNPAGPRRQRRLFLCDISSAAVALTPLGNVCIDNFGLRHSSFEANKPRCKGRDGPL